MKSSTIAQKLNLQQLISNLKMLNQQNDQSKQQIFQPLIHDLSYSNTSLHILNHNTSNSSINLRTIQNSSYHQFQSSPSNISNKASTLPNQKSQYSPHKSQTHNQKQEVNHENILEQYCRKQTHSQWSQGPNSRIEPQANRCGVEKDHARMLDKLKEMNMKLLQDNRSLIMECIRLRKLVKQDQDHDSISRIKHRRHSRSKQGDVTQNQQHNESINRAQIQNLQYLNHINKLQLENLELRLFHQVNSYKKREQQGGSQVKDESGVVLNGNKQIGQLLEGLKKTMRQLSVKLEQLRESDRMSSNKLSRSNTTTIASRNDDIQKQRMKVLYEDRIKILEGQISIHKQQLRRLHFNGSSAANGNSPMQTTSQCSSNIVLNRVKSKPNIFNHL